MSGLRPFAVVVVEGIQNTVNLTSQYEPFSHSVHRLMGSQRQRRIERA